MKKGWNLLFIITVLVAAILLSACGNSDQIDPVFLDTYTVCRVNLSPHAYIIGPTENIRFWVDGEEIAPDDIIPKNWVNCEKIDPNKPGLLIIKTVRVKNGAESSHVQLAKQGQGEFCPHWARRIFGRQCQSETLSVY